VDLSISGANGATLLAAGLSVSNSFTGTLPATQDYLFKLTGGASPENFVLNVIIAARIQFAVGEKTAILTGRTNNGLAVTYSAYAQKGQKMDLIPMSPARQTTVGAERRQAHTPRTRPGLVWCCPHAGLHL
jgi:hypothetical protein